MKKAWMAAAILFLASAAHAETSWRELFKETEGKVLDFAIASSLEAGYARDMVNGTNMAVAQSPVVYLTPFISGDFGYVTGYDDSTRGTLMFGGSLRLDRLIESTFPGKVDLVKSYLPGNVWNSLWFGPWVAKKFSDIEGGSLMAGIKGGLKF